MSVETKQRMPKKFIQHNLKLCAIGFGNFLTPSTRYRLLQFIPFFEDKGALVQTKISSDLTKWSNFSEFISSENNHASSQNQIIWIQKKLFPLHWIWRIPKSCQIVFDFDDAIWTSERKDRSKITNLRAKWKLNAILKKSTLVIAGNQYLADYASNYARRVVVMPTVLNADLYPKKIHVDREIVILGWIGQSVNFKYLLNLKDIFEKLNSIIKFKLLVISDKDFQLPCIEVINRRWSVENEIADILEMDVGLMPLDDSDWTRGKCAFKAIQYMAAGIPTVASHVGANTELISNGVDGFLAKTDEDWVQSIVQLSVNAEDRSKVGGKARKVIEDRYSLRFASFELLKIFQDLTKGDSDDMAS